MYDELTCAQCGFNPKEQDKESGDYKSEHWKVNYHNEYFPSADTFKSWETFTCPICDNRVYSTL